MRQLRVLKIFVLVFVVAAVTAFQSARGESGEFMGDLSDPILAQMGPPPFEEERDMGKEGGFQPPPGGFHKKSGGEGKGGNFKGGMGGGTFAQLELTSEQREKLKSIMQSHRQNKMVGNPKELMNKRHKLMGMIKGGSGSKEQAIALLREISQQQNRMIEQRINMLYDMKSVLTPEQFSKFQSMMQQKKQQRRHGGMQQQGEGFQDGGSFQGRRGGFQGGGGGNFSGPMMEGGR